MKIKIIDSNGVVFDGKILPKDTVLDIEKGPHTTAWFRFKQAEEVKEEATSGDGEGSGRKGADKKPEAAAKK